jgi:hypothetical protein
LRMLRSLRLASPLVNRSSVLSTCALLLDRCCTALKKPSPTAERGPINILRCP